MAQLQTYQDKMWKSSRGVNAYARYCILSVSVTVCLKSTFGFVCKNVAHLQDLTGHLFQSYLKL